MVILDQMKVEIQNLRGTLEEVTASLDLDNKKKIIEELSREMEEPGFWDNAEKANKKTKDLKNIPFPYDKKKWPEYSSDLGLTASTPSWVKTNVLNYYKTGNKETILNQIYTAKAWAVKNKVPIIINEFGAYNLRSTAQDRLNYLTAMREICDTLQVPWTHWGYTGGFEVIKNGKLVDGLDKAFKLK